MKRSKTTFSVKEALELYLSKNRQLAYRIKSLDAIKLWETVVDDYTRNHTKAAAIKEKVLFVYTESTVLSNELTLQEKELVDRLNDALHMPLIEKIVFKSGYIGKKSNKKNNKNKIDKNITMKTISFIDRTVSKVKEEELRDILRKFLITTAKRKPNL